MFVALIIGFTSWAWGARVLRAQTLSLRRRDYIEAARAIGAKPTTIMRKYLFGNVVQSVPVIGTLNAADAVGFVDLPHMGRIEVRSTKWNHEHFNRMLADLTRVASALPFTADAPTAIPFDRHIACRDEVLYHAFVYLRYVLSEAPSPDDRLMVALNVILNEPHQ